MNPIFTEYESRLIRRRRDPQTLRLYRYAIARYEAGLDGADANAVDPATVEQVFADLAGSWHTRRNVLQHVRSAYRYAHRRGVIGLDPTYDVDIGRAPEREPVTIPNAELRRIQAACRNDDDLLRFALFAYTGLRKAEVAGLRWEDVNLQAGFLRVLGKGGKLRRVPIHPALGELLAQRRYHLGQPVIKWIHWGWLGLVAPGRTFHDFRRTVATSLRRNGADPSVIDRICGWSPRSIRERYYNAVDDDETRAAILRLYCDDPI